MKTNLLRIFIMLAALATLAGCGGENAFTGENIPTGGGGTTTTTSGSYTLSVGTVSTRIVVGKTAIINATLVDGDQVPVASVPITFSVGTGTFAGAKLTTSTTDASGNASVLLTAPLLVGTDTVTVTYGSVSPQTLNLTYDADLPATVRLDASPATVGVSSDSTLTATVYDQHGNVAAGQAVVFSIVTNNSNGILTPPTSTGTANATTNASGVASVVYTSGTTLGTDTVKAEMLNSSAVFTTKTIDVSAAATSITTLNLALSSPTPNITVGDNTVTVDATVLDNLDQPLGGVNVAFQIVGTGDFGGTKSVIVPTLATNGVASVTLNAPILVGSATITATTAGKSSSVAVTYIPDVPAAVTLSASPTRVGVSSDTTLTASLYDQHGNVLPNEPVTFSIPSDLSGGAVLSNPVGTALTNASGIATMTYTSGPTAGNDDTVQVDAVNGSAPNASTTISVSAAATSIASLDLSLTSPTTNITVGDNSVSLEATVLDDLGDPVGGANVSFQIVGAGDFGGVKTIAVATNQTTGVASVTLNAPTLVSAASITAATAGLSQSVSVSYIPDVPAAVTISASPAAVGVSSDSTLTAVVYDQYGNVTPNEPVTFSIPGDLSVGAVLSNPLGTALTNSSGVATMTYTSGTTAGNDDTVQVDADNGSGPTDSTTISVSSAATSIASLALALTSPSTIITVNDNTVSVEATVLDDLGDPVGGVDVAFEIVGTGDFGGAKSTIVATNTTSGVASVILDAPTLVGSAIINAATGGKSASIDVTYIPDVPASVTLTANPTTVGVASPSTLTAEVLDQYGNVTPNEEVTFAITPNGTGTSPYLTPHISTDSLIGNAVTNSSGVATITYTSGVPSALPATDKVSAVPVNGTATAASADITLSASSVSVGSIKVTSGSASIVADGSSTTAIRAQLLDTNDAPIVGQTITFTTTAGVFTDGSTPNSSSTTANTDANGFAIVTLESSTDGTIPTATGTAAVSASVSGFSASTAVEFVAGAVDHMLMYASPTTLPTGAEFYFEAVVMDKNNNRINNERVTFRLLKESDFAGNPGVYDAVVNSYEDYTDDTGIISNTFGIFDIYALDAGASTLQLQAVTANGTTATQIITIDNTLPTIGGLTLVPVNSTITADALTQTAVRATVVDTNNAPVQGASVTITTSAGQLLPGLAASVVAVTDANGVAEVFLLSTPTLERANLTASISGFNASAVVDFVAGPAVAANSSITVSPSTLPADGSSTATVTVTLADANFNPVIDGTAVTLLGIASDAAITSSNPATTSNGRATFTLQAASVSAVDNLYLAENSAITGKVTYGATGTGEPANIQVSSAHSRISVAGVGQTENTSITITVVDEGGSLIADPAADNIRVTLLTRPNGGEYVSGTNFAGTSVSGSTIDIATSAGKAVFNLQAGSLPGIVEIRVETIGYAANPSAIVPQIVIASGPAHSIAFGRPLTNAVINLGAGNYQRIGSITVTDRYGNSVADGTVVNLGMVDSVIVDGVNSATGFTNSGAASLGDGSIYLTDGSTKDFTTAAITRNGTKRLIQQNDRVLILDAVAEDKSRHVGSGITANVLPVQTAYTTTASTLSYVVGSATLGGAIFGVDPDTNSLTPGYVTTVDGIGEIRIDYPAKRETILIGCGRSVPDTRHLPNDSADTYVVASVSGTDATSVTGEYCFSAIAGYQLSAEPAVLSGAGVSDILLGLKDGGDGIPLPFVDVSSTVLVTKDNGGLSVSVSSCDADGVTDVMGYCTSTITVTGGVSGDAATVTYDAGDATAEVAISIP